MNTKTIFFGSDKNSAHLLQTLIDNNFNIILVITKLDKKSGRDHNSSIPTPVKIIADKYNIKTLEKDKLSKEDEKAIKNLNPYIGILLAYGAMIPVGIIKTFPRGILNIHPSLLPLYRGPSPIQYTLLNADKNAGVSLMLLEKGMDSGEIITQEKILVEAHDNYETLSNKLFLLGEKLLLDNIQKYVDKKITPKKQNESLATFSKIIEKNNGMINWSDSAKKINSQIKAYYKWPNSFTKLNNQILKIKSAEVENTNSDKKIGEVFIMNKKIAIQCGNGLLYPQTIQLEGKKETNINSFVNGYKGFVGSILN